MGINRTAGVAAVISTVTILFFVTLIAVAWLNPVGHFSSPITFSSPWELEPVVVAAGVVFFAFAGYARVATLGNEVRDSKRNIPKAIVISLSGVLVIYLALAWVLVTNLGNQLLTTETPVAALFQAVTDNSWVTPAVAAVAGLGSMLAFFSRWLWHRAKPL